MKSILTSTALATVLVFGLAAAPGVRAQDAQVNSNSNVCTGENCPSKKMKKPEQTQQMNEQNGEQATPRKKKMGTQQNGTETNAQVEEGTQIKKKKRMGVQENGNVQTQTGEETVTHKKRRVGVHTENDVNVDVNTGGSRKWRFDPSHERRSHSRSTTFRFYYEGWYYPQPYWTQVYVGGPGYGYGRGISCRAGRAIVAQRFNRVRVVDCKGRTFAYLGRRNGATFRVLVDRDTGRVIGRAPM